MLRTAPLHAESPPFDSWSSGGSSIHSRARLNELRDANPYLSEDSANFVISLERELEGIRKRLEAQIGALPYLTATQFEGLVDRAVRVVAGYLNFYSQKKNEHSALGWDGTHTVFPGSGPAPESFQSLLMASHEDADAPRLLWALDVVPYLCHVLSSENAVQDIEANLPSTLLTALDRLRASDHEVLTLVRGGEGSPATPISLTQFESFSADHIEADHEEEDLELPESLAPESTENESDLTPAEESLIDSWADFEAGLEESMTPSTNRGEMGKNKFLEHARLALLDQFVRPLQQVTLLEVARAGLPFEVFQEISARKLLDDPTCRKLYSRSVLNFAFYCTSTTPSGEVAATLIDREQQKASYFLDLSKRFMEKRKASQHPGQFETPPGLDPEEFSYTIAVLEEQREYLIKFFGS